MEKDNYFGESELLNMPIKMTYEIIKNIDQKMETYICKIESNLGRYASCLHPILWNQVGRLPTLR